MTEDEPLIAMELAQTIDEAGGTAFGAAAILAARKIPFLFCTADSGGRGQFAQWPDAPIVAKPHNPRVILDALSQLLQSRS